MLKFELVVRRTSDMLLLDALLLDQRQLWKPVRLGLEVLLCDDGSEYGSGQAWRKGAAST